MESNQLLSTQVPELLTVRQACSMLKCSLSTFNKLVKSGRLHVVRLTGPTGDRKVRLEDVVELRNRWSIHTDGGAA